MTNMLKLYIFLLNVFILCQNTNNDYELELTRTLRGTTHMWGTSKIT